MALPRRLLSVLVAGALALTTALAGCARTPDVEQADQISQNGITWKFDRKYRVGQFVTGDWWVVGPVRILSVTPEPTSAPPNEVNDLGSNRWGDTGLQDNGQRRNGSMIVMSIGLAQGYDSRGSTYDSRASVTFPVDLGAERSLISSVSEVTVPNAAMHADIMWNSEKQSYSVMKAAAVLTSLGQVPPGDAFRPSYVGGHKQIFRASSLRWDRLQNLPVNEIRSTVPSLDDYARYLERPWIDHLSGAWQGQWLLPVDNQPAYGREFARIVGTASLLLNTDASRDQKRRLLYGLVQYGIDLNGMVNLGAVFNEGGGVTSGRKWPIIFASLMLGDPLLLPSPRSTAFHEDTETYYGKGWYGQQALWQMVMHHGTRQPYQEKPPNEWDGWDETSEQYRTCCTVKAWVAQDLAALLMSGKAAWNHNAFFDVVDDWMRTTDEYVADRQGFPRPTEETASFDRFVDAFWKLYRDKVPAQPDGAVDLKWDVNLPGPRKWVPNPN